MNDTVTRLRDEVIRLLAEPGVSGSAVGSGTLMRRATNTVNHGRELPLAQGVQFEVRER